MANPQDEATLHGEGRLARQLLIGYQSFDDLTNTMTRGQFTRFDEAPKNIQDDVDAERTRRIAEFENLSDADARQQVLLNLQRLEGPGAKLPERAADWNRRFGMGMIEGQGMAPDPSFGRGVWTGLKTTSEPIQFASDPVGYVSDIAGLAKSAATPTTAPEALAARAAPRAARPPAQPAGGGEERTTRSSRQRARPDRPRPRARGVDGLTTRPPPCPGPAPGHLLPGCRTTWDCGTDCERFCVLFLVG